MGGDGRKGSTGPCATVVIPLLNALTAGGCVEKRRKGEGRRERECLGSTATAAAARQDKRRKKKKTAGLTEKKDFF